MGCKVSTRALPGESGGTQILASPVVLKLKRHLFKYLSPLRIRDRPAVVHRIAQLRSDAEGEGELKKLVSP
jgi:hypothetical protein